MSTVDDEVALLRTVLSDNCPSDEVALRHIAAARALNVDPLDYCAHRFGLGNVVVWQRAAHWAGVSFALCLPSRPASTQPKISGIDRLGETRSLVQSVLGEETLFCSPRFDVVVALAASRRDRPTRGPQVRFVPPEAIETAAARAASEQLIDAARQRITRLWPRASAAVDLPLHSRIGFVAVLTLLVVLAMTAGLIARPVLVPLVATILIAPGLLRLLAAFPVPVDHSPPRPLTDAELPVYTVLIPLRDEAKMVPLLRRAMSALDYPSEKLDIKFVVETRSSPTVEAVETVLDDPRFRIVAVPDAAPRTKPKAIDYALPLARGAYVVVYDAEDVPEPDQLRKAASRFAADADLACLQAELLPENASENALTALFAGEYAGLFSRLLPALARWGLPVPLGGTSNHFRTDILRAIGGWDAFNVTEDADLGVRLARRGLRAETLASRTYEEAPIGIEAWMAQRTRWMKGWMQTFIVHNSAPGQFLREIGWRGFVGFQVLVGGMILSSILHTVFFASLLVRLSFDGVVGLIPQDIFDWFAVAILAVGYGGTIAMVVSGLLHQKATHLLPMQVLLPGYWVLHSIAAVRAAIELITKPVYWAKTEHGLTRLSRSQAPVARSGSGRVAAEVEVGGVDLGRFARQQVGEDAS